MCFQNTIQWLSDICAPGRITSIRGLPPASILSSLIFPPSFVPSIPIFGCRMRHVSSLICLETKLKPIKMQPQWLKWHVQSSEQPETTPTCPDLSKLAPFLAQKEILTVFVPAISDKMSFHIRYSKNRAIQSRPQQLKEYLLLSIRQCTAQRVTGPWRDLHHRILLCQSFQSFLQSLHL